MDISPAHQAAVSAAIRIPALEARLALLTQSDPQSAARASIFMYGTNRPAPGGLPGAEPIVTITLSAVAGAIDEQNYQMVLDTPVEGQVVGADPSTGTVPVWARICRPNGDWWADASVSVTGKGGEIQMTATGQEGDPPEDVVRLFNGAYARLTSAIFQG